MGRRRRKIIKKTPKAPPSIFVCPLCGAQAVSVAHEPEAEVARVTCASCKASTEVKWYPAYTPVDAYSEWYDLVTKGARTVEAGEG
ncbi:MAG: hypothetical protein NXY59_06055 [Aigarchaeota archaeon]|nr:hypothetical protein [Candidatus Pelearchaeum maunauluense]